MLAHLTKVTHLVNPTLPLLGILFISSLAFVLFIYLSNSFWFIATFSKPILKVDPIIADKSLKKKKQKQSVWPTPLERESEFPP